MPAPGRPAGIQPGTPWRRPRALMRGRTPPERLLLLLPLLLPGRGTAAIVLAAILRTGGGRHLPRPRALVQSGAAGACLEADMQRVVAGRSAYGLCLCWAGLLTRASQKGGRVCTVRANALGRAGSVCPPVVCWPQVSLLTAAIMRFTQTLGCCAACLQSRMRCPWQGLQQWHANNNNNRPCTLQCPKPKGVPACMHAPSGGGRHAACCMARQTVHKRMLILSMLHAAHGAALPSRQWFRQPAVAGRQ